MVILRKEISWSQTERANKHNTLVCVISRYERDEMNPSIDASKKLAYLVETAVVYLLGEMRKLIFLKSPRF
jgi:transcriptional regulator with XRE-family HTH domain